MPVEWEGSLCELSSEHLRSLGAEAFWELQRVLKLRGDLKSGAKEIIRERKFSRGQDKIESRIFCLGPEKRKEIGVHVVRSGQSYLAFALAENGVARRLCVYDPEILIGSESICSTKEVKLDFPDEDSAIMMGIKLSNFIVESISSRRVKSFDLNFKPHDHS